MEIISINKPELYNGAHQECHAYTSTIKARLYHWRNDTKKPAGTTPIEIQAYYIPGGEPYILIGEEGCEPFEPSSGALKITIPDLITAMSAWCHDDYSEEQTALGMADYLEMLAKTLRRSIYTEDNVASSMQEPKKEEV